MSGDVRISRPSGVNVGQNNPGTTIYITGNESTDGSLRLQVVASDGTTVTEIQRRISGIWQPTSFKTGAESVLVGTLVSLSAVGDHLITTFSNAENVQVFTNTEISANFLAESPAKGGVTTSLAKMLNAINFNARVIFRSDESESFTGTSIETQTINNPTHLITSQFYFKTDAVAASQPVRIQAWDGFSDTGQLIFDQTYPASEFPANTEIVLQLEGFLEFDKGANTLTRITSDADFSLKTDGASAWWLAIDFSEVKDDDLLQTTEFLSGDNFNEGDWTTQNRRVFVCNTTGVQTGGFNNNLDKWDLLEPPTMHDRQDIIVEGPITTTSTTFEDIPGARLLTGDLGSPGNYQIWLSISIQQSNNNTSITFRVVLDGVPGAGRTVFFGPGSSNEPQHATLIGQADSVSAGSLIEFQWLVSGGEGQINGLRIMMDGIREDRVIPSTSPGFDSYLLEDGLSSILTEAGDFLLLERQI